MIKQFTYPVPNVSAGFETIDKDLVRIILHSIYIITLKDGNNPNIKNVKTYSRNYIDEFYEYMNKNFDDKISKEIIEFIDGYVPNKEEPVADWGVQMELF